MGDMDLIPHSFLCPIRHAVMRDPVIAGDGHSYEREAIERWIQSRGRSPLTTNPLSLDTLIPNLNLKQQIDEYRLTHGEFQDFLDDSDRSR